MDYKQLEGKCLKYFSDLRHKWGFSCLFNSPPEHWQVLFYYIDTAQDYPYSRI